MSGGGSFPPSTGRRLGPPWGAVPSGEAAYESDGVRVYVGGALEVLRQLPSESVHCCVTSPPYWGLRSYLPDGHADKALELGTEPTPELYVERLVEVFHEVRRVLRADGTVWLNVADSYGHGGNGSRDADRWPKQSRNNDGDRIQHATRSGDLRPKDLCLIPERLALALQADGWWIRSRIAWGKTAPMPESVRDRPACAWEHIWLLAKSESYFYDAEAVKEPLSADTRPSGNGFNRNGVRISHGEGREERWAPDADGRNLRNFWLLGPSPFAEAHFAVFPPEVPTRAILAGTSARGVCPECAAPWVRAAERGRIPDRPNRHQGRAGDSLAEAHGADGRSGSRHSLAVVTTGWQSTCACDAGPPVPATVLDPCAGSGTSLAVARRLGRNAIGAELNPAYLEMIERRVHWAIHQPPEGPKPVAVEGQVSLFDLEAPAGIAEGDG